MQRPLSKSFALALLLLVALRAIPHADAAPERGWLEPCHGASVPLRVSSQMPYAEVDVAGFKGAFVLDFASTGSSIDPRGFGKKKGPAPVAGTSDQFGPLSFFGSWGTVRLSVQDHSGVRGQLRQAGILGTDFLAQHAYTLDYQGRRVYRQARGALCSDETLLREGLRAASTAGHYSDDPSRVLAGYPRVPSVPVRVAGVAALAQLDTGFDDGKVRHAVNVNRALFAALEAAGVRLTPWPRAQKLLSTCVPGVSEQVSAYRLPQGATFEIVGVDGDAVVRASDALLFLKAPPPAATVCGGIGTFAEPAAQIGGSFYIDARRVLFDPFRERVWFGGPATR